MNKPYLIQRGQINKPPAPLLSRLTEAVELDDMGAAEFEFGKLPQSLRRIEKHFDMYTIRTYPVILEGDKPLYVFGLLIGKEADQYLDFLRKMRDPSKRFDTKKATHFEQKSQPTGRFDFKWKTDFWWDIENDVMWSFDKDFMHDIKVRLEASFNYMNAEQAKINPFEADGGLQAIKQLFAEKNTVSCNYQKILAYYGSNLTSLYGWYAFYVKYADSSSKENVRHAKFALAAVYNILKCFRDVTPIQSEEGSMTNEDLDFLIEKTEKILDFCSDI